MHFGDESRRQGFDHRPNEDDFQRTLTAEERGRLRSDQGGAEGVEGRPSELDARFFQDNYYGGIPFNAECRLRVAAAGQGEGLRFKSTRRTHPSGTHRDASLNGSPVAKS
jgi:hypothetical protein